MKLEIDIWHHLLKVHTKFQIDISKHVKKAPKTFKKSETHKNNCSNFQTMIFAKTRADVKKYTEDNLCTKFERFILSYKNIIAKIYKFR